MAARIKANIKPQILIWARESAGFALTEASKKIGVSNEVLQQWEAGEDSPTIPKLRKISSAYKRPLAVFFLQEVPKDFQAIKDLRRLPGHGLRRFSPELLLEIRRANQRRHLALELFDELKVKLPIFKLVASENQNPEIVGQNIRESFGITNDMQGNWSEKSGRVALKAWRTAIENAGVLVFQAAGISSDEASGFALTYKVLPTIVINRKDSPRRRIFSLLHELTHLMLRVSGVSDLEADVSRPPEEQKLEVFCNHVAAAALMPKEWLLSSPVLKAHGTGKSDWTDQEIASLASMFSVSREALVRRLLVFGRTTQDFYKQKAKDYYEEYLALKQKQKDNAPEDGIPRNMPQETLSNLGVPFVQVILENYNQERLTLSDVAGYLNIKTKHIPKLEQMVGVF